MLRTGALHRSPWASGRGGNRIPDSVTVDPSGKFAYVANSGSSNVSAYTINATTGALTAVPGSPFAAGTTPVSVTVDPSGKFAYVANSGSDTVSAYTIDPAPARSPLSSHLGGGIHLRVHHGRPSGHVRLRCQ